MYREECIDLLRRLLELRSREASLKFRLSQLVEEARVETIRLSGLVALCRTLGHVDNDLQETLSRMIDKYLGFEARSVEAKKRE